MRLNLSEIVSIERKNVYFGMLASEISPRGEYTVNKKTCSVIFWIKRTYPINESFDFALSRALQRQPLLLLLYR